MRLKGLFWTSISPFNYSKMYGWCTWTGAARRSSRRSRKKMNQYIYISMDICGWVNRHKSMDTHHHNEAENDVVRTRAEEIRYGRKLQQDQMQQEEEVSPDGTSVPRHVKYHYCPNPQILRRAHTEDSKFQGCSGRTPGVATSRVPWYNWPLFSARSWSSQASSQASS